MQIGSLRKFKNPMLRGSNCCMNNTFQKTLLRSKKNGVHCIDLEDISKNVKFQKFILLIIDTFTAEHTKSLINVVIDYQGNSKLTIYLT